MKRSVRGFTILEVLLAITILAAGAILVFPGLRRASDYLKYLSDRQGAEMILNGLMTDAEIKFRSEHHLRDITPEGEIISDKTTYRYHQEALPVNANQSIMEVKVTVNWLGEGTTGLTRSAYVSSH